MLKNFPFKTVLLTLLAWMLFWEIKETITGERMLFLYRWIYSNMSHAKNIEVLTYLLTDEQVSYMLAHPDEEVTQPSTKELSGKYVNVVIRLRNKTGGIAYGKLAWKMYGIHWNEVDVGDIPVPGEKEKYGDVIISMGVVIIERGDDSAPDPIKVKWEKLYVYR